VPSIPWLDSETAAGVRDIVSSLAAGHPEVRAVILFGSAARREQRPLDDPEPSDVDLLVLLDPSALDPAATRLTHERELAITNTIGEADYRHGSAPRAITTMFIYQNLAGWDALFIENVAHDGILLWSRGPLPSALLPVSERAQTAMTGFEG